LASAAAESDGACGGVAGAALNRGRRACRQRAATHLHAAPSRSAPPHVSTRARMGRRAAVLRRPRSARAEHRRRFLGHAVRRLLRWNQRPLVRGRLGRSQSRERVPVAALGSRFRRQRLHFTRRSSTSSGPTA
jgi:hypothetical protein